MAAWVEHGRLFKFSLLSSRRSLFKGFTRARRVLLVDELRPTVLSELDPIEPAAVHRTGVDSLRTDMRLLIKYPT